MARKKVRSTAVDEETVDSLGSDVEIVGDGYKVPEVLYYRLLVAQQNVTILKQQVELNRVEVIEAERRVALAREKLTASKNEYSQSQAAYVVERKHAADQLGIDNIDSYAIGNDKILRKIEEG